MKKIFVVVVLLISGFMYACGRLDDQSPVAQFNVQYINPDPQAVDETHPICLGFFTMQNWADLGGVFCISNTTLFSTDTYTFIALTVPFSSAYLAAWHDLNNDRVPTTGEPAMGYNGITPVNNLTQLLFPKLEFITVTIVLDGNTDYP